MTSSTTATNIAIPSSCSRDCSTLPRRWKLFDCRSIRRRLRTRRMRSTESPRAWFEGDGDIDKDRDERRQVDQTHDLQGPAHASLNGPRAAERFILHATPQPRPYSAVKTTAMTISIAKYASVKVLSQEMCSTESSTTMMMLVEISVMMTASKTRLGPNLERRPYFDARTERTSQQYPRSVFFLFDVQERRWPGRRRPRRLQAVRRHHAVGT